MPSAHDNDTSSTRKAGWFATTHWSVVLAAGQASAPGAREALEKLCRVYWYPLYAYIRRQGRAPQDAQDLTQAFFARLLQRNDFAQVHPSKGKFRSFLLAAANHFLADEWDKVQAAKRGGGQACISLDGLPPEARYQLEPTDELSAERIFERRWALTLLDQARERLREEYVGAGQADLYEHIRSFESGDQGGLSYAAVAGALGISENTVKSHIFRLRRRFGQLVRQQIAHTVSSPAEVDEEIRYLLSVLAR